jgi:hypothetical protein
LYIRYRSDANVLSYLKNNNYNIVSIFIFIGYAKTVNQNKESGNKESETGGTHGSQSENIL